MKHMRIALFFAYCGVIITLGTAEPKINRHQQRKEKVLPAPPAPSSPTALPRTPLLAPGPEENMRTTFYASTK